jgi:hypothetical protein
MELPTQHRNAGAGNGLGQRRVTDAAFPKLKVILLPIN